MVRLSVILLLLSGFFVCARAAEPPFKDVLPEAASFTPVKNKEKVVYYQAKDKSGNILGAAFIASGKSYSDIETLVGMLNDGTIAAIKVLAQNETPGIGSRVAEPAFTGQFRNLKDISNVQAISGATVSSSAVIEAVKKKAEEIKQLIRGEQ